MACAVLYSEYRSGDGWVGCGRKDPGRGRTRGERLWRVSLWLSAVHAVVVCKCTAVCGTVRTGYAVRCMELTTMRWWGQSWLFRGQEEGEDTGLRTVHPHPPFDPIRIPSLLRVPFPVLQAVQSRLEYF